MTEKIKGQMSKKVIYTRLAIVNQSWGGLVIKDIRT